MLTGGGRAQEARDLDRTPPTSQLDQRIPKPVDGPNPSDGGEEPGKTPSILGAPKDAPLPPPSSETIVVVGVTIKGSTVYEPDQLSALYEDILANSVTVDAIRAVADRITDLYRADGFFLSQAFLPPQSLDLGIVRIEVIEGYIEEVGFGDGDPPAGAVRDLAGLISSERPLRLATLERSLLLMGDTYGRSVRDAAIETIDREAGRNRLVVDLAEDRFYNALILDNRGTEDAGRHQLWASLGANNLFLGDTQFQVSAFTIPRQPQELKYVEGRGSYIVNTAGTTVTAFASTSESDLGGGQADFGTESSSTRMSIRAVHPLLRSREASAWVFGGFHVDTFDKDIDRGRIFEDELRIARGGVNLFLSDDWDGFNRLFAEASWGLDLFGASGPGDLRSRFGADASFSKLRIDASRVQRLLDNVWVEVQLAGQVADGGLLSSEEFSLGGTYIGRAYEFGEISGDHGIGGLVELQYGRDVDHTLLKGLQAYGFYDAGAVWNEGRFEEDRETLASAGLGLRLLFDRSIRLKLEYAYGLTRPVNDKGDNVQRVFFSLSQGF